MISRTVITCFLLCFCNLLKAQLFVGSSVLMVKSGSILSIDGLVLKPDKNTAIRNTTIQAKPTIIKWPLFNSIKRVYYFSTPLSFSGTIGMYVDYAMLEKQQMNQLKLAFSAKSDHLYSNFSIPNNSIMGIRNFLNYYANGLSFGSVTAVDRTEEVHLVKAENFLTPNGDGINDTWVIQNIDLYPGNQLRILDRAGKVIYTKTNYQNTWDGTLSGVPLAQGTYYYILELAKNLAPVKGFITIIRD
ncbi:gliding motility-associated C-terminal domain-containing protein [Pedobacter sp. MW01-1-1]|uniref:gliding motility-associated C-terminal domain-containing protein n=1 Tax=Pedobacter sp. MW01-1-1 TaxID=3383027 RepID=UPI003FEF8B87